MKVYLKTFGCRANQYDTEAVRAMLMASDVKEVDTPEEADVAVFNSCTVTAEAEADLRAGVRRAARENPRIRTIVMGCAAGVRDRDESKSALSTLPRVDAVIPGADLPSIAAAVGVVPAPGRIGSQSGARALLRVQDGCDEHCTFCATTGARGANRSRAIDEILVEAQGLAATHPEIVVTGIHIGTYGTDNRSSLGELMTELISGVENVRFRLSSVEATEVDEKLARLFEKPARLAPHLHAPLQSGSDRVLRRMGRHWYTADDYAEAVERLTAGYDVFALSGDVIGGFPGESEDDHRMTLKLVERLPFTSLHVFPYSARPGTAATRLGGQVSGEVARRRAAEVRALAAAKARAYEESRIGGLCDVVVTDRGRGLTGDYLSVAISDKTIPRRARLSGVLTRDSELTVIPA
jgi:threonylcarbamoyladenosine tRNA methylthiotransferase MtaB